MADSHYTDSCMLPWHFAKEFRLDCIAFRAEVVVHDLLHDFIRCEAFRNGPVAPVDEPVFTKGVP